MRETTVLRVAWRRAASGDLFGPFFSSHHTDLLYPSTPWYCDPSFQASLPAYDVFCKRALIDNSYFETLQRPAL